MKTVYKYQLDIRDTVDVTMPKGAQILCAQVQNGIPHIWALVDLTQNNEVRRFKVRGTGHDCSEITGRYVSSFQMLNGALVYHVWEEEV